MRTKSRRPRTAGPYAVRVWRFTGSTKSRQHEHVGNTEAKTRGEAEHKAKTLLLETATRDTDPTAFSATVTDAGGEVLTSYSVRRSVVTRTFEVRREHAA